MCLPRQKSQATVTLVEGFLLVEVVAPVLVLVLPPSSVGVPGSFFTTGDLCAFFRSDTTPCISIVGGSAIELPRYKGLISIWPSEYNSPEKLEII
jgi:hypothetical protein